MILMSILIIRKNKLMIFDNNTDLTKDTKIKRNQADQLIDYYEKEKNQFWSYMKCNWSGSKKMKNIGVKNRKTKEVITFYELYDKYKKVSTISVEDQNIIDTSQKYSDNYKTILGSILFYLITSNILHSYPFFNQHRVNNNSYMKPMEKSISQLKTAKNISSNYLQKMKNETKTQSGGNMKLRESLLERNTKKLPPFFIYGLSGLLKFFYLSENENLLYKNVFTDNEIEKSLESKFISPYLLTPTQLKNETEFDLDEIINENNVFQQLWGYMTYNAYYKHSVTNQLDEVSSFMTKTTKNGNENELHGRFKAFLKSIRLFNKITSQYLNSLFIQPHRLSYAFYSKTFGLLINKHLCSEIPMDENDKKSYLSKFLFFIYFIVFILGILISFLIFAVSYSVMISVVLICSLILVIITSFTNIGGIFLSIIRTVFGFSSMLLWKPIAFIICLFGFFFILLFSFILSIIGPFVSLLLIIPSIIFDNLFIPRAHDKEDNHADNIRIDYILGYLKWFLTIIITLYMFVKIPVTKNAIDNFISIWLTLKENWWKVVILGLSIFYLYYKSKKWNDINEIYYELKLPDNKSTIEKFLDISYYFNNKETEDKVKQIKNNESVQSSNVKSDLKTSRFCGKNYNKSSLTDKIKQKEIIQKIKDNNLILLSNDNKTVLKETSSDIIKYILGPLLVIPTIGLLKGIITDLQSSF